MRKLTNTSILIVARGGDPIGIGREVEFAAMQNRLLGIRVHVVFLSAYGSLSGRLSQQGVNVQILGKRHDPDMAVIGRLAKVIFSLKPAVVITFGQVQATLSALAIMLQPPGRLHPKLVCRIATTCMGLRAWALRRAHKVLVSSSQVFSACKKIGISTQRLCVVNPLAHAASSEGLTREDIANQLKLDKHKLWTLCAAPLNARSHLSRLLWAIDQLGIVRNDVEHVLVGSGPQLRQLVRRAQIQQLEGRLRIIPSCDCLPDLLRETQLVWQSGEVALGGALFDAMSLGKPTVAIESDAAEQAIVSGQSGWIVPLEPASEFARCALSVLEDQKIISKFHNNALERAKQHFSAGQFLSHLETVMNEVVENEESVQAVEATKEKANP